MFVWLASNSAVGKQKQTSVLPPFQVSQVSLVGLARLFVADDDDASSSHHLTISLLSDTLTAGVTSRSQTATSTDNSPPESVTMATLTPSNRNYARTVPRTGGYRSLNGLDAPSSTHSKNARIDDSKNKEYYFPPILPATATPDLSLAPSKSILKLISAFDGLVSDPASLSPLDRQPRQMTPEPENALQQPTYLLSPVETLVGSVSASPKPEPFASSNFHDLIEAYCILNSRIRSKVLDLRSAATVDAPASQPTTIGSPSTPYYPAFESIKDNIEVIVVALKRDISRALEDPLALSAQYPVSPPASDASHFSSEPNDPEPGKRKGMNEHQVKLARDLHTVSQSALKLLSTLFSLTSFVDCENSILSGMSFLVWVPPFTEDCLKYLNAKFFSLPS
jgi:hypothetical protein